MQGLQPLHNRGMSHTDLKAENILVCDWDDLEKMNVVILDLGGSIAPVSSLTYHLFI